MYSCKFITTKKYKFMKTEKRKDVPIFLNKYLALIIEFIGQEISYPVYRFGHNGYRAK